MKNQIKYLQNLFYDLLNDVGRVYIVIKHSENTTIGKRGFTEEEKKNGLVLVFNQTNFKNLEWTEDGSIIATLGFGEGNRPERCFINADDIISVFSPDAKVKFERWDWLDEELPKAMPPHPEKETASGEKIVSLEKFRKKPKR
ncbi:MAG: hypothetical protein AB1442_11275 [Nitrospirota bacterium]